MKFDANISKVLRLFINSVYTNQDTSIREFVSNASDACEKLRYKSFTEENISEFKSRQFKIEIEIDRENGCLIIKDNGIGLSKEEMITHLGTIASSGTEEFIKEIESGGSKSDLIGKFGVGFYSGFIIAKKIEVRSSSIISFDGYHLWESEGIEEFNISEIEKFSEDFTTEIKLFLKDEFVSEYLDQFKIENIIKTYSSHVQFDIYLRYEKNLTRVLNDKVAIWRKQKTEINDEEYNEFYKSLSNLPEKPFGIIHKNIEGSIEFKTLLFIPSSKPFDLYHPDRITKLKLYVKKVFINEAMDLLPKYLRFIYGIIESDDLPLNINRETIQNNSRIKLIKDKICSDVIKYLKEISEKDKEKYEVFWNNFGPVLKEGLCEGLANRDELMSLLRFKTSKSNGELTSLSEYILRIKEGQKEIYYITGEKYEELISSSELEIFKAKDIEVIIFNDHVDIFWLSVVADYKDKDFKSVSSSDLNLENESNSSENNFTENEKSIIEKFSEVLIGKVAKVSISHKLVDSPACISRNAGSMDPFMEKILIEQKQLNKKSLKVFEINPRNKLIIKAFEMLSSLSLEDKDKGEKILFSIFDLANLNAGEDIENKSLFSKKVIELLSEKV